MTTIWRKIVWVDGSVSRHFATDVRALAFAEALCESKGERLGFSRVAYTRDGATSAGTYIQLFTLQSNGAPGCPLGEIVPDEQAPDEPVTIYSHGSRITLGVASIPELHGALTHTYRDNGHTYNAIIAELKRRSAENVMPATGPRLRYGVIQRPNVRSDGLHYEVIDWSTNQQPTAQRRNDESMKAYCLRLNIEDLEKRKAAEPRQSVERFKAIEAKLAELRLELKRDESLR